MSYFFDGFLFVGVRKPQRFLKTDDNTSTIGFKSLLVHNGSLA